MASSRLSSFARYFLPKPPSLEIGKELSRGAYGAVHYGRLDGKEVAVKRIHKLLLEAAREQGDLEEMLSDFWRECELLQKVDHPHVIEFQGAFYDETTDEPILVMELMTENLRQYLQRNRDQLSRQKQLEICISIVRGLSFLHMHSPPIVHRDLTDKNILLDANGVVKISDLGQSRLKTADYFSTGQPGAIPFMSPEAMQEPSHYNEKLDMFSLGVLMLEVATQQFPCVRMVGIGTIPELQRRGKDLSKLDEDHPLQSLILSCLKDNPKERPDIVTVHTQLLAIVEGVELETVQSTASRPTQEVCSPASGSEVSPQVSIFPSPVFSGAGQHALQTPSTQHTVQMGPLQQTQLQTVWPTASRPRRQEVCSPASGSEVFQTSQLLEDQPTLLSVRLPDLPIATAYATAIVIARNMYVCGELCPDHTSARVVQVYDLDKAMWTKLPPAPQYQGQAVAINNQLVLLGGRDALFRIISNMVSTWTGRAWQQDIPAMPTKRKAPGVTTCGTYVIVAGGMAEDENTLLSSIDVLDTTTQQWRTLANLQLPRSMYTVQITVNATHIRVICAALEYFAISNTVISSNRAWQLPVSTLTKVLMGEDHSPHDWEEIAPTPLGRSALLQHTAHPLAVGGHDMSNKATPTIAMYDPHGNKWSTVGQLLEPRGRCAVVSLSSHSFLVCGGLGDLGARNTLLSSVEVVSVQ